MSRLHYIRLRSPNDARRFAGYMSKPGAHVVVNSKANLPDVFDTTTEDGNIRGPINTADKPYAYEPNEAGGYTASGWVSLDHMADGGDVALMYRQYAAFMMVAIAVPVE
ncbi:hypothetical protein [Xanthomonas phage SB3]|uniref:Uncharacterized protein n=1 Tax=Xanthomonas phage SB3 TaxID=3117472 RepID=A0ABZ2GZ96_9CAUD